MPMLKIYMQFFGYFSRLGNVTSPSKNNRLVKNSVFEELVLQAVNQLAEKLHFLPHSSSEIDSKATKNCFEFKMKKYYFKLVWY